MVGMITLCFVGGDERGWLSVGTFFGLEAPGMLQSGREAGNVARRLSSFHRP
ncbi:hypothetical protein WOC76_18565 [Methylocystis sp. IM3]|jgi:hypothetical protein|uniref:hypothetical protein n=1 Tax=unclassified Methylocystis TaxID=2625913 RepID=UPI003119CE45